MEAPSMTVTKRTTFMAIYIVFLVVLLFGGLSIIDYYFLTSYPPFIVRPGDPGGPVDPRRPGISVNTYTFYPFTGGHTQANFSIHGGKVRSGDHGFNVDFDLDHPPAKTKGEYRLVMIGG